MAERHLVVGGIHAARIALARAPQDILEMWLKREHGSQAIAELAEMAREVGIPHSFAEPRTLDKVNADTHHQGVVFKRRSPCAGALAELEDALGTMTTPALLLILDGVQDPRNFGACLRVGDGAGVDGVIFTRDRSTPLTSVVAKVASGAIDTVRLYPVTNLRAAMQQLKRAGVWLAGAAHDAEQDLYQTDLRANFAIVLGSEGRGLRRLTREHCDILMRVPMFGHIDNLNVATAAAVCLFEARRQRQ